MATGNIKDFEAAKDAINGCDYLFADSVREIEELTLELILTEAKLQAPIEVARNNSVIAELEVGGRPIERDSTCRSFRIVFDRNHIISYTVLNESYGRYPELPEQFRGKLFRTFSWSHLLEFTKRTTYASDEYPGALLHYEIACLNHVFDVITTSAPAITLIPSTAQRLIDLGGSQPDAQYIPRRRPPYN